MNDALKITNTPSRPVVHYYKTHFSVCIDIELTTKQTRYSVGPTWAFGSCLHERDSIQTGKHTEKCCLPPGKHSLTCENTEENGWMRTDLTVQGHIHCNDFVGYKAMRTIPIIGMLLYIVFLSI